MLAVSQPLGSPQASSAIKNAVTAAKPPRAVFLSSLGSEKLSGLGLITTTHILEQELDSTGVPSAFLRAGTFMENIIRSIPAARATEAKPGDRVLTMGCSRLNQVSRRFPLTFY